MTNESKDIRIFGEDIIDIKTISQLQNCLINDDDIGVLTPDAHYGYAHPIGGAVAYKNHISVSGVGFDIACGNKAVRTNIHASDVNIKKVMDEVYKRISFGVGRNNNEKIDHEVIDKIAAADFVEQRAMTQLAWDQLGTVGSGNHFIDLFVDTDGYLWIGVHFGSRGFGHKTATGFMALANGLGFTDKISEGSMDSLPVILDTDTYLGQAYIAAMSLAGEYAYAGRDCVVNKVLEILGNPEVTFSVHNHHNFAWREEHYGDMYWVVRKGCTPAFPGQFGFIGANMHDDSVIVMGVESKDSETALYSTVHGAGRIMSRRQAAGKTKWKKLGNTRKQVIITPGCIDFKEVKKTMKNSGIELRGAGADEAPDCYKKLTDVLGYMPNNIEIMCTLTPIGVAMAGNDIYDPYKD